MNAPFGTTANLKISGSKSVKDESDSKGPIPAPHAAVPSLQTSTVPPLSTPTGGRVSLMTRLRVAAGLIVGLRASDFQAAATFVRLKYAGQPLVLRWRRFVGWALRQMFHEIPRAMPYLSTNSRVSRTPFWLIDENPLANHPWVSHPHATLPADVDTVVIGAGFTGGALAYHWARRAPRDRRLVVLEMDDPASGTSGRNLGQVVMGRYFMMVRDSVRKHLETVRSDLAPPERLCLAEQFADRYCRAAYRNAELIEATIRDEQFDCDYVRTGWVQVREANEQPALVESVRLAIESGYNDWTRLTPEETLRHSGAQVRHDAGYSQGAASWHPAKWVWSLLRRAMRSGNVDLFTRTKVLCVANLGDHYEIQTQRGAIRARHVVYATETYTPQLDRRLKGAILSTQEQAACGHGGPEAMPPRVTVSSSWFFAGRYGRRVIFGSGGPRVPDREAGRNRPSRFLTKFVAGELGRLFGPYKLHLTHEWSGTTGYTPDEYPIVGRLDEQNQYIIGGMCGSGSGVSFNASRCIVNRILGISDEPDDYPPEFFGPTRLLAPRDHLWPVCTSSASFAQ